jgi:hypothetical protein
MLEMLEMLEMLKMPWIPDGDSLRQQSRPHAVPLRRAAGEGSRTGGGKAPIVRRP